MGSLISSLCNLEATEKKKKEEPPIRPSKPSIEIIESSPISRQPSQDIQNLMKAMFSPDPDALKPLEVSELRHTESPGMSMIQNLAKEHKITDEDFEFHDLIGVGGFSRVYLAHLKNHDQESTQVYAIKTISKFQFKEEEWDQFKTELKILSVVSNTPCSFLTHLYCSFQSDYNLYFCLEYVSGGSLRKYIDLQTTLDLNMTTFVAAEILLGLLYLHEKLDIVHRDLKPENVLIDAEGHCKLTDFGLSKIGKIESYSFCGTLNYLAPELTKKQPYNKMVDFWMLGCIIYEMLVGRTPFAHKNKKTMLDMINAGCYRTSTITDPVARDLISKLLVVDPRKRLGAQGPKELLRHPFFRSIDFKRLLKKELASPLKELVTVRAVDEDTVNNPTQIPDDLEVQAAIRPRLEKFSWIKLRKMSSEIDSDFLDT